jgi:hypothetical protein
LVILITGVICGGHTRLAYDLVGRFIELVKDTSSSSRRSAVGKSNLYIRTWILEHPLSRHTEMLFAHLKRILWLDRLRLRGPNGARDEFLLAATVQNLRKLAKLIPDATAPA